MQETVEISRRMRITSLGMYKESHLEIKTKRGWEKVFAKRPTTLRSNDVLNLANKIALFILLFAITWAVLVRMNH